MTNVQIHLCQHHIYVHKDKVSSTLGVITVNSNTTRVTTPLVSGLHLTLLHYSMITPGYDNIKKNNILQMTEHVLLM